MSDKKGPMDNSATSSSKKPKEYDSDDSLLAADTLPGKKASKHPKHHDNEIEWTTELSGAFRGIAAATRKMLIPMKKVVMAKGPAAKQAVRAVGQNRPLAFASEGAVAGESMLPRVLYYGAWGLSGAAICADIYNKQDDAPPALRWNTVLYWTAFHIPASLVVPAMMIHRIVHTVEHTVQHSPRAMIQSLSPRAKAVAPVVAALLSIIPVVPIVDHTAEFIMEPTLGAYLGLSFDHHHHNNNNNNHNNHDNNHNNNNNNNDKPKQA